MRIIEVLLGQELQRHRPSKPGVLSLIHNTHTSAAEFLRDAALKTFCNQLPESGKELASQPTLSRLENQVDRRDLWRLGTWLIRQYVKQLKKSGRRKVILDFDSTADPTHGQQEFSFWHGFYDCRMYHPLLVFDAETGDLICALLRAGNTGAARCAVSVLKRLVKEIRRRIHWKIEIEVRGDSGFAIPDLYEFCEEEKLTYTIGFARHSRLVKEIEGLVQTSTEDFQQQGIKQRRFMEFSYQAGSWDRSRRMIKIGARIKQTTRRIWIHCSSSYPEQETFLLVLRRICPDTG